jgi:pimeloyl-ACP methyl ester carboxylesterase
VLGLSSARLAQFRIGGTIGDRSAFGEGVANEDELHVHWIAGQRSGVFYRAQAMADEAMTIWSDEAGPPDAPLVVLIHGSMDRSTGMLRLSRRLDGAFRVLRYDRRGYGKSAPADHPHQGPFDMHAQVGDLMAQLAGRRAVLIGHSYGGNVALAAAAQHPDEIAGVAVYETPLSWEPWWPGTTAGAAARATDGDAAEAAERFMRRLVSDPVWEGLPERTKATRRREGSAMVGELRDLAAHRPWQAADVRCPVVLSYGELGAPHHRQGMQHVHALMPGSALFVLPRARHDAPMSNAEEFAATVVDSIAVAAGDPWAAAAVSRRSARPAAER